MHARQAWQQAHESQVCRACIMLLSQIIASHCSSSSSRGQAFTVSSSPACIRSSGRAAGYSSRGAWGERMGW